MRLPDEPEPLPGSGWIMEAWAALQSCRPFLGGMAVIPLPMRWFDVQDYADRLRCTAGDAATLHQCIAAMDRVWLRWRAEEAKEAKG